MGSPSVERDGKKLYLLESSGAKWRVHDVQFREHKPHRVPLGDGRANTRYFIGADGTRKCILLRELSRALGAETMAKQLAGSGYIGSDAFDPSEHGAR